MTKRPPLAKKSLARRIVAIAKGCINSLIIGLNTLLVFAAMIPFALLKAAIRTAGVRRVADTVLNALAASWVKINGRWITASQRIRWDVEGIDELKLRGWYLVSSNHQSWVDILVLQKVFDGHIPFLKFFLKKELIYVPVIGLAWWALDFPFMQRKGGMGKGKTDLATTRKACERFKLIPTSVMNFLEGTRFTQEKHFKQRSPYKHLLKPRVGGIATALATMGETFDSLLDVTIVYPPGVPTFWDILSGQMSEVVVRVRPLPIPRDLLGGDYERDAAFRARMQTWVSEMWQAKDQQISDLLARPAPAKSAIG
ncbi:acyltransferase [Niveibacterium umoris]|uniref:1-acyl-sn-glycerol-3-phosphate acyltransferase n=1 Tax=Niveibacterium umoris TaxID=1193620 RepID=A0A840BEL9_9RHOO|nr:acyltransferase [Niveibacterium umoris]MBB4011470.1 1-acyl-sn-glycerol-3-phosphate acyltransferase [Niveibacterium umoris]